MITLARHDTSLLGRWWWTVDRWLLGAILLLAAVGALLVTAASPPVAERLGYQHYHFVIRHLIFLGPAVAAAVLLSMLSPVNIRRFGVLLTLGALALVAATHVIGTEVNGAARWLRLGPVSLQPSELLKPGLAITCAWILALRFGAGGDGRALPGFIGATALIGISLLLLVTQPDLGMTIVVACVWGAQLFLAGLPLLAVVALGLLGVIGIIAAFFLLPHVQHRIQTFMEGESYQVSKSLAAFRNGGLTGTGPGQGEIKYALPDAHADFIFSVAGEEFGLIAALMLLGLFGFIVLRGFLRSAHSVDLFTLLAVSGILVQVGLQALIHMASSVHLVPTKGMTLPFISYGGSSLLGIGIGLGMLLALTRSHPDDRSRGQP